MESQGGDLGADFQGRHHGAGGRYSRGQDPGKPQCNALSVAN